jgi:hypothetical protein
MQFFSFRPCITCAESTYDVEAILLRIFLLVIFVAGFAVGVGRPWRVRAGGGFAKSTRLLACLPPAAWHSGLSPPALPFSATMFSFRTSAPESEDDEEIIILSQVTEICTSGGQISSVKDILSQATGNTHYWVPLYADQCRYPELDQRIGKRVPENTCICF